ncbi:Nitrite reductase [NAD(P)H] [compost metagenome]
MERVGLDYVKQALEKKEERLALKERLEKALSVTTDPWKQIIQDKELRKNYEQLSQAAPVQL